MLHAKLIATALASQAEGDKFKTWQRQGKPKLALMVQTVSS